MFGQTRGHSNPCPYAAISLTFCGYAMSLIKIVTNLMIYICLCQWMTQLIKDKTKQNVGIRTNVAHGMTLLTHGFVFVR